MRKNLKFITAAILAVTFIGLVIAYKYTGDFSGIAKWGTDGRGARQ